MPNNLKKLDKKVHFLSNTAYLLKKKVFLGVKDGLDRYNNKLKLMKKAPRKVYVELLHRGYDTEKTMFYYHSRNDKETDFVLREGNKVKELIQVCYDMSKEKTIKREVESIVECAGELSCDNLTIVTWNEQRIIEKKAIPSRLCL